jgi:hypothetical protein
MKEAPLGVPLCFQRRIEFQRRGALFRHHDKRPSLWDAS